MKKLLLIGSNQIHLKNYHELVAGFFDEVFFITNSTPSLVPTESMALNFSLKNPIAGWRTIQAIKKKIKTFHPDVIHIHQAGSFAFYTLLAAKKFNIPVIVTAWGSDILISPNRNFALRSMVKYILNHADYFSSDSGFMAVEMNRLADKELNVLIANFGIDSPSVSVAKEKIIYSNRLHKPLYRIDKIIIAFASWVKKNPDWKLVIGATGEKTESLKQLAVDLKLNYKIEFVGWLDKKKNEEYYSKSTFYVSIPESDATSISLLEAMAHGCIPVVSDLPANKEWIENGVNGIIVNDLENLFNSIGAIDIEKAKSLNKKIIEERATKESNRRKFISLYEKAMHIKK
ncbi:hypothetical protein LBMAG27_24780 [Bacteroidota bacterium]|nr:hypothetical protein LBMAG27_24780 [Bacteroidota bacterium]